MQIQIHELNTYTGTPGAGDWFAIDDGSETTKIEASQLSMNYYGTCSTAAGTTTKVVTCPKFVLKTGAMIAVRFDYGSTTTSACYLNVNSTGAKRIRRANSSTQAINHLWDDGSVLIFVYDGSSWLMTDLQVSIDASVITQYQNLGWTQD